MSLIPYEINEIIMKICVVAEGSEENIDLLLLVAKKLDINISRSDINSPISKTVSEREGNAYLPWKTEDDEKLEILYYSGKKIKELGEIFERNEGAIRSRIKKLE